MPSRALPPDLVAFCRGEHPRLVGSLSLYCGDRDVAQELAQEAIARVCRDWRKVRAVDDPRAWVHRVGINLANSYYRRRIAERKANARAAAGSALPDPGPDLETASAIRSAVSSLPRRQRTALVMRYYLDLPVRDVARHMDCSEGTVKALTSQAVSGLRRHPQIIDLGDLSNV